jgi:hypothetical protein
MLYQDYSCEQLREEAMSLSSRAIQASGIQDDEADQDALVTAAAIVVFWPAAFFIEGNGETAAELSRLKGEIEAVERVAANKRCGIQFRRR